MRRIRASFQFFAQGCHINTQGGNVIFLRTAPYFLREGGMRQHFAHIMRQHTQQFVLDGGQMQFILAQPDAACREVDLQRTIDKNRTIYAVRSQQIQSALRYTQSCQQLIHGKRLCQIIVCAVVQCFDLIRILAPGTQDDDGQVRPCADAADDLDAVYIGQPKIQQHDVRVVAGGHHDRRFSIGSSQIFIAVGLQGRCDQTPYRNIILYDQNGRLIHEYSPHFAAM